MANLKKLDDFDVVVVPGQMPKEARELLTAILQKRKKTKISLRIKKYKSKRKITA